MEVSGRSAKAALRKIYQKYPGGGVLHVVVDDDNYETCFIQDALDNSIPKLPKEDREMFITVAKYLLSMPENKRKNIWKGVNL